MKIYEAYYNGSENDSEWNTTVTLKLHKNGRFEWEEYSTCYFAEVSKEAKGRWKQNGQDIFFTFEESTIYEYEAGQQITAVGKDGQLIFSYFILQEKQEESSSLQK